MHKPTVVYPIIVEGKYDKIKITSLFCADVFVTDGFGVFRREDKAAFFRKLAEKTPIIILTDSDGAGIVIRKYFLSILPRDRQIHLYTPEIWGKEKRKTAPSKAGKLGVEGMEAEVLRKLMSPYILPENGTDASERRSIAFGERITKADMYALGLSGGTRSAELRKKIAAALDFPVDISPNALLTALQLLYSKEEFFDLAEKVLVDVGAADKDV